MGSIARAVRHEHERWDGNGYPDGLAGEEIPSRRGSSSPATPTTRWSPTAPTARRCQHREAIAELTTNAGTQFDPQVVEALVGYLYGRRQSGLAAV